MESPSTTSHPGQAGPLTAGTVEALNEIARRVFQTGENLKVGSFSPPPYFTEAMPTAVLDAELSRVLEVAELLETVSEMGEA